MQEYKHLEIEKKWQNYWEENKTFKTDANSEKPKFYALDMFPYPSGAGLHVGHPEGYTATDILSRMKRMQGFEVMHPMGWDAFGLPAEQYAIATGNHPREFNDINIANFKKQIQSLGFSYDWDREINTTHSDYYKWSQWIFKKLYENDLAELKNMPVNFCPECGTVLANEEVVDGKCERKGHDVIKKDMQQWVLKITKYADRLLEDLDDLDWPESLKDMQRNWIGRTTGANIVFKTEVDNVDIEVYTTRPDTIFGVELLVIAPENELVKTFTKPDLKLEVEAFIDAVVNKSELERTELNKDKSGIFTGSYAIHPITGKKIAIWVGDYVLNHYGTGAVMSVPAHDDRDFEFAQKYNIDFISVYQEYNQTEAYTQDGTICNSDFLNGLSKDEAIKVIIEYITSNNFGEAATKFKLRDWLFSRQRYWGEPFPVVHMPDGSIKLVDDQDLPVELPFMENIEPSKDGTSPLSSATDWLEVTIDGETGIRETNTMPQWAGSCWYYLRYLDPHNDDFIVDPEIAKKWLPVDIYIGGAEHAVLHLLYARFWHKFLYDINVVPTKEPFYKLFNQGMILGEGNVKMSKSLGNVINPDDIVTSHGADTLRVYEMFMGPLDASIAWSEDGLDGARRFLDRVWRLYTSAEIVDDVQELDKVLNQTIKKVEADFDSLSFNTAISQMMIFVNEANKVKRLSSHQALSFIKLLSPIAPHLAEEVYTSILGENGSIAYASWPIVDESKLVDSEIEIIIQLNGKLKNKILISADASRDEQLELAKQAVNDHLVGVEVVKEIVVPKKLVNFVVKG